MTDEAPTLAATARTTLNRLPQRGAHDRASINAVLDAGLICQIGYVMDGGARVLPTVYWRDGDAVYWHGARESRALEAMAGAEVCLTVTLLDGLVMARSAFHHSVNYRSVMAFGRAEALELQADKARAAKAMLERLYPGRWPDIRAPSRAELAAITMMRLPLTEASAKVRDSGPVDAKGDLDQPAWAGVIPLRLAAGAPVEAADLKPGGAALTTPAWPGG